MSITNFIQTLILLLTPVLLHAATMIETRDGNGEITNIYIDGNKARLEMPGQEGFVLMDISNKSMKIALHEQRVIMDLSSVFNESDTEPASAQVVAASVTSKGSGPLIASYATKEYEMFAEGKYCGSAFVSVDALKNIDLRKFVKTLNSMTDKVQKKMDGMVGVNMEQVMSPCERADNKLGEKILGIGFPLRFIDQNKHLQSEVTRIDIKARLPTDAFMLPAGYVLTTPEQMMGDAMKLLQQNQPQLQEMMQNLPPELMDMMRKQMQQ